MMSGQAHPWRRGLRAVLSPALHCLPPDLLPVTGGVNGHLPTGERHLSPLCTSEAWAKFLVPSSLASCSSSCLSEVLTRGFQAGSDEIKAAPACLSLQARPGSIRPHHPLTSVFITTLHVLLCLVSDIKAGQGCPYSQAAWKRITESNVPLQRLSESSRSKIQTFGCSSQAFEACCFPIKRALCAHQS